MVQGCKASPRVVLHWSTMCNSKFFSLHLQRGWQTIPVLSGQWPWRKQSSSPWSFHQPAAWQWLWPCTKGQGSPEIFFCRLQVCSLYLLSILSTQALGTSVITPNQPVGTSLHFDGLVQCSCSQGMEERSPVFGSASQKHQHSFAMRVFQLLHDDLLEKEATKVLPFSWK